MTAITTDGKLTTLVIAAGASIETGDIINFNENDMYEIDYGDPHAGPFGTNGGPNPDGSVEVTNVTTGVSTTEFLGFAPGSGWENGASSIRFDGEVTYSDGTKSIGSLRGIKLQNGQIILVSAHGWNPGSSGIDTTKSIAQLNIFDALHFGSNGQYYYAGNPLLSSVFSDRAAIGSGGGAGSGPKFPGSGGALCFVAGTKIQTADGYTPVEDLEAGTMVMTKDHGYQPVRWIGSNTFTAEKHLAPIVIKKGTLGNFDDLRVSPQHRVLLTGWQAELLFGESEVLVPAKALINDSTVLRVEGGEVQYFHVLFDNHEIIYSEGAETESFNPGKESFKTLDEAARAEILELFPQLEQQESFQNERPARTSLKITEGALFSEYLTMRQAS